MGNFIMTFIRQCFPQGNSAHITINCACFKSSNDNDIVDNEKKEDKGYS
jgi:hypothetical protein